MLNALSPLAVLERGYSVTTDADGKLLRRAADFQVGCEVSIRVSDARVRCDVKAIEPIEDEGR